MKRSDSAQRMVVALGGHALSPPGVEGTIARQFEQTRRSAVALVDLLETGATLAITHGNGPQVGSAVRRIELAAHEVYDLPLSICVADLQGGMGYMIAQCLYNELHARGDQRSIAAMVTSVEVSADDPAFDEPTKPIGPYYPAERAHELMAQGWHMAEVPRRGFRRVVASPRPIGIIEIDLIRRLVHGGESIIAVGGGGVPVVCDEQGRYSGREAVIDKDRASALLASEIDASILIMVTDVEAVSLDFGTPQQRAISRLTMDETRRHLADGQFPPGSMGPKMEAAIAFLSASERSDRRVIVTDIDHIVAAARGDAGTQLTRS